MSAIAWCFAIYVVGVPVFGLALFLFARSREEEIARFPDGPIAQQMKHVALKIGMLWPFALVHLAWSVARPLALLAYWTITLGSREAGVARLMRWAHETDEHDATNEEPED